MQAVETKRSKHVAHVDQGKHDVLLFTDIANNATPFKVDKQLAALLESHAAQLSILAPVQDTLNWVSSKLESQYGGRLQGFASPPSLYHDGQLVLRVLPVGSKYDADLAVELNDLTWEMQDYLCDLTGDDEPPVLFGFRQVFDSGEEEPDT